MNDLKTEPMDLFAMWICNHGIESKKFHINNAWTKIIKFESKMTFRTK